MADLAQLHSVNFIDQTRYANEGNNPSVTWTNAEVLELLGIIREQIEEDIEPPLISADRPPVDMVPIAALVDDGVVTATAYRDEDWEYGICFVDKSTGRKSFEQNYAGDPRSLELAQEHLALMKQNGEHWSESTVARRRRTEWEQVTS